MNDGWEQSDRGEYWFNTRFRRAVDPNWERCILEIEDVEKGWPLHEMRFTARAGRQGKGIYTAAFSPIFKGILSHVASAKRSEEGSKLQKFLSWSPGANYLAILEAHDALVRKLLTQGWERIPYFLSEINIWRWWIWRFRRRAK